MHIKTITRFDFFLWLLKYLKNVWLIGLLINTRNVVSFLVSSMVLGLLNQLQTLTFVFDRIAGAFNKSSATRAVVLDISNTINVVWHASLLHKFKTYGIPGRVFSIILTFHNSRLLQVVLDGTSLKEYVVNATVPQGSIFGPTLFELYINDLPNDVCDIAIYVDETIHYSLSVLRHVPESLFNKSLFFNFIKKEALAQSAKHCRQEQDVACWFQFQKKSIGLTGLITRCYCGKWMGQFLRKISF